MIDFRKLLRVTGLALATCLVSSSLLIANVSDSCDDLMGGYHQILRAQADILKNDERSFSVGIFCLHGICESGLTSQNLMLTVRALGLEGRVQIEGYLSILSNSNDSSSIPAFDRRLPDHMQNKIEGWIPDDAGIVSKVLGYDLVVIVLEGPETFHYRKVIERLKTDSQYRVLIASILRDRNKWDEAIQVEKIVGLPQIYFLSDLEQRSVIKWDERFELLYSILDKLLATSAEAAP